MFEEDCNVFMIDTNYDLCEECYNMYRGLYAVSIIEEDVEEQVTVEDE